MTCILSSCSHVDSSTPRDIQPCDAGRLDMEMHLQGQDLANAITEDGTSNAKDKANALIFIRRHLHESLHTQYLSVRDP